jgi:C1A family cysteine protease
MNWQTYESGVFSNCKSTSLNFAALLVGIKDGSWIIKNDWGVNWG